jgi:hypothetical protein
MYRLEKDVKREVKKLLDVHRWFWFCPPANGFGKAGISDFLALRAGVFMAIETKVKTNKPTPMQKAFLSSIAAEDGFGFVVNDSNIDSFSKWLDMFDEAVAFAARNEVPPAAIGGPLLDAQKALTEGY